jgi:hypothetical protein
LTLLGGALLVVEFSNPEPWSNIPAIIGSGLTAAGFTLSLGFLAAHDPPLCDRCRSKIVPETMNYCPECAEPIGDPNNGNICYLCENNETNKDIRYLCGVCRQKFGRNESERRDIGQALDSISSENIDCASIQEIVDRCNNPRMTVRSAARYLSGNKDRFGVSKEQTSDLWKIEETRDE